MASPTKADSERKIIHAKESGQDPTLSDNKMKKVKNLMNWCDKFHQERINFTKEYDNIVKNHPKMNTPNEGQSKKNKKKPTLEDKLRSLYVRSPGLIIPNMRKRTPRRILIMGPGDDLSEVIKPHRPKE